MTKIDSPLIGGDLALDFANTAGFHAIEDRAESLGSYRDLVAWSETARLLSRSEARKLILRGEENQEGAESALRAALVLRDTLQALFSRSARKRPLSPATMLELNRMLVEVMSQARVVSENDRFRWAWTKSEALDQMLRPIVRAAADLLTSNLLSRLRECSGRDCSRLFLDTSRNGSRRWCSMAACGNRSKVRRHYRRHKADPKT
jgi:Conserved protein containing a Zn-ribbon-like motif, possibly RNA-binding